MRVAPFAAVALIVLQGTAPRDDGQWTMPGKNYAATRYSGLSQVPPANASRPRPVSSFSTALLCRHAGPPLGTGRRVIVGPAGGEFGIYGWVKGLDVATGKILWTAHNMGPDSAMLARPGHGHYGADANLGVSTWEGDSWRRGGAPVWGWIC